MPDNEAPPRLDILITLIAVTIFNIFLIFDSIDSRKALKQRDSAIETLQKENKVLRAQVGFLEDTSLTGK